MIEKGQYYLCSENKEADQLRSYCKLICIFVFAFAKNWFSYYVAPLNHCRKNNDMNINVALYATQIC